MRELLSRTAIFFHNNRIPVDSARPVRATVPSQEDSMRTITLSALTLLSACVYDNNCPDRQRGLAEDILDTGAEEGLVSPEYYLSPDAAMAGDTVILSLQSDQAVDFMAIEEIRFLDADVSVCTMTARDEELLLTISVHPDELPGGIDMIIHLEDGENIFVEAGFTILDPNADERPEETDEQEGGNGEDQEEDPGSEDDDPTSSSDSGESSNSGCA
jgi:hypothetical protein